ncbi:hypothetical protein BDD12DRAFT_816138 [Trichophaea hybrida]|nr:hypothetical protein BDD12DRAFT_816138 [Trichophaea hybrida]
MRVPIQLRFTAEDVSKDFSLLLGKIFCFIPPFGRGVRVETRLRPEEKTGVSPNSTHSSANSPLLHTIVSTPDFKRQEISTT